MFRNKPLVLVGWIAMALLSGGAVVAQEPPCLPDCFQSPWQAPQNFQVTLPGGCEISVEFVIRFACNVWNDVQILRVEAVEPAHSSCNSYAAMESVDFLALVTKDLLEANPMGFPPPLPTPPATQSCRSNWRVLKGSCWRKGFHQKISKVTQGLIEIPYWQPCSGTSCCLKHYTVCVDPCGNRTSSQTFTSAPPVSCPVEEGQSCTPVCG